MEELSEVTDRFKDVDFNAIEDAPYVKMCMDMIHSDLSVLGRANIIFRIFNG